MTLRALEKNGEKGINRELKLLLSKWKCNCTRQHTLSFMKFHTNFSLGIFYDYAEMCILSSAVIVYI